ERPFALFPGRLRSVRHGASVGSVSHVKSDGSEPKPDQIAAEVAAEPCNVADYERLARERLDPGAFGYYAGGAGDERTLRENVEAFSRWLLRPRTLVDVSSPSTETSVLGTRISMPLLVAPVAFQRIAHPDGEPGMARAAAAAGTAM